MKFLKEKILVNKCVYINLILFIWIVAVVSAYSVFSRLKHRREMDRRYIEWKEEDGKRAEEVKKWREDMKKKWKEMETVREEVFRNQERHLEFHRGKGRMP